MGAVARAAPQQANMSQDRLLVLHSQQTRVPE
jgi:hypothetical protein